MSRSNNEIFIIESLKHETGQVTANLTINKYCPVFDGHFPGQPVVPGACMVQVVKDVLENILNIKVILQKATNIKFISMILPGANHIVNLIITYKITDDGNLHVNAKILTGDDTCFKLQGIYSKI
jgi:3-hydroxyacyl-[acyl-carrier-protein] dehydratase